MRWRDEGERKGRGPGTASIRKWGIPSLTKSRLTLPRRLHRASHARFASNYSRILDKADTKTTALPRLFWVAPFLVQSHAAAHGEYFPNCRSANYAARINSFLMITLAVPFFGTRSCPSTRRLNRECTTRPLPSTHAILFRFPPSWIFQRRSGGTLDF